jgi:glucose-1-phosphate adenylyltransferase
MAIGDFVERHRESDADLTVAVKPVPASEASALGIMRIDDSGRIVEFVEKPKSPELVSHLALDEAAAGRLGPGAEPGMLLASMGIYVFRAGALEELLAGTTAPDFGRDVIPAAIHSIRVFAFPFTGYWRDIGTIPHFHDANLELTRPMPPFDLYHPDFRVYTHPRFLPGTKINQCTVETSILCEGSIISGSRISDSIIGIRALVREGSVIERSVVMGANSLDVFRLGDDGLPPAGDGRTPIGVGRQVHLRNAIVDFNARIGDGARLVNEAGVQHADGESYCIRGGVIVVPRDAEIPPGTVV